MKTDEYGEYDEDAGSKHPVDPDEVAYEPCNAVLKHTWSRYGERRYCSGMAVGNFGDAANYEHEQFCKHHQQRAALMKRHAEQMTTGAQAKSHEHLFQHLEPHKQVLANDLYASLLDESTYSFETETVELEIDVSDDDFAGDADTLVLDHPVPSERKMRGKALWHASLDFLTMESIRQEQFRVAAEESFEGRDIAVGERVGVVGVSETGPVRDVEEHHLNLPLSRITKNYKDHMTFGGVEYDTDDQQSSMGSRDWVAVVEPEPSPTPEADTGVSSPLSDVEPPEGDSSDD